MRASASRCHPVPLSLCSFKRLAQIDVPFVHSEGVAPANFHLGPFGVRIRELVAPVCNGALDQIKDPPGA